MAEITFDNFDKKKLRITSQNVWYGKQKYSTNLGHCRRVYKIGNVIIKFDYCKQKQTEQGGGEAWHQTPDECRFYHKIKQEDRKYFPRTRGMRFDGRIVELQEFIAGKTFCQTEYKEAAKIVTELQKTYGRCDYHSANVVLKDDETPVVVDFGF